MTTREISIRPRKSFRPGETVEINVSPTSRCSMWIGSDEKAGYCWLTKREMRALRDALNIALGEPEGAKP